MQSKTSKFSILLFVILAACSPKVVTFSNSDVKRASEKFPGATEASLTEGKTHYQTHCASCHMLKSVTSQSEEGWRKIVPKMVIKTNKKAGSQVIDSTMERAILTYVVTMATAPQK